MPTGLAYTAAAIDDRAEALIEEIKHRLRRARAHAHAKPCVSDERNSDHLERRPLRMVTSGSSPVTATTFTFPALSSGTC
jgi:hypothetical protein